MSTTTSNAANNIEAKSRSLKEILKDKHYKVDYFQREYKWQRDNIEELIIDLEQSFFTNYKSDHNETDVANYNKYYMGPIVLFEDSATYSIVDGQQRLTSFSLLLIFLNDQLNKILEKKDKLKDYIYSDYYGNQAFNLNIEERTEVFDFLFREKQFREEILQNESCLNLLERYTDIEELFPKTLLHPEIISLFVSWLTEKLVFVEIVTQTSESAYTIFETMNDRGLNLTPTEMLKSFLLSKSGNNDKIKELDQLWKNRINLLRAFHTECDIDFFKAWLRGKYAITVRSTDKGASNEDFEKIGTRFHSWVKDNYKRLIHIDSAEDFYLFVNSDFDFFSTIYIRVLEMEYAVKDEKLKLIYYKGISNSLSHPLILSPIEKTDDQITISQKINLSCDFIDSYAIYRLLLDEPITHSSIRNAIYLKIKEFRNLDLNSLKEKFKTEIDSYKNKFLETINYVPFNSGYSKYLLARIFKLKNPEISFESLNFQRRKDSFILYQFLTPNDVDIEAHKIPSGLKELFVENLCTYCLIPRGIYHEVESLPLIRRIKHLISNKYILEVESLNEFDQTNLKDFFIERNKRLKEAIINTWKISS